MATRTHQLLSLIWLPKLATNVTCPQRRFLCTEVSHKLHEHTPKEKVVKVAIIGVPNAGKSTFINNLVNHRVCPTSNKVHTTRHTAKAVTYRNNSQIIVFDTPGLVTDQQIKKHHLEKTFLSSCRHSLNHADMVGVIHDVSNNFTRHTLHPSVIALLQEYPKLASFLVLNKIDTLKSKRVLLELVRILTCGTLVPQGYEKRARSLKKSELLKPDQLANACGWHQFSDVFMVSSLTGDGLSRVVNFIEHNSKPSQWEHHVSMYTDQTPENLIVNSVRARLLDYLPQEIPYLLFSELEFLNIDEATVYASVLVTCPNSRVERLVCGAGNGKLRQITERATSDLVETFGKEVSLTIGTRAKPELKD